MAGVDILPPWSENQREIWKCIARAALTAIQSQTGDTSQRLRGLLEKANKPDPETKDFSAHNRWEQSRSDARAEITRLLPTLLDAFEAPKVSVEAIRTAALEEAAKCAEATWFRGVKATCAAIRALIQPSSERIGE